MTESAFVTHSDFIEHPSRLQLTPTSQGVTAQIVHFINGPVVQASTTEWAIRKNLYKTTDTSAYVNLARVNSSTLEADVLALIYYDVFSGICSTVLRVRSYRNVVHHQWHTERKSGQIFENIGK